MVVHPRIWARSSRGSERGSAVPGAGNKGSCNCRAEYGKRGDSSGPGREQPVGVDGAGTARAIKPVDMAHRECNHRRSETKTAVRAENGAQGLAWPGSRIHRASPMETLGTCSPRRRAHTPAQE